MAGEYFGVPPAMTPEHRAMLDAAAQKQGFRDYASYYAFTAQKEARHSGSVGAPAASAPAPAPAQHAAPVPQGNWLNSLASGYHRLMQALGG